MLKTSQYCGRPTRREMRATYYIEVKTHARAILADSVDAGRQQKRRYIASGRTRASIFDFTNEPHSTGDVPGTKDPNLTRQRWMAVTLVMVQEVIQAPSHRPSSVTFTALNFLVGSGELVVVVSGNSFYHERRFACARCWC